MANICEYKIVVKGKKNACYAFLGSTPQMDYRDIQEEGGTDDDYMIRFEGDCKWAIDCYCEPYNGEAPIKLPADSHEAFMLGNDDYWFKTVKDRSRIFAVEVICNSADIEDYNPKYGPYNIYEHYVCGEKVEDECPEILKITGY
ncbi:MAG: hypothetical protein K5981_08800 [Clostridia bacterium]|nr:hypothetical protein [Clostridia bacterium]